MVSIKNVTPDRVSRVEEARAVMRLATRVGRMVDSLASEGSVEVDDSVLIADYKTDIRMPTQPEDAPENYLIQLARYRTLLARALPGRAMRAFLVWTAGPAIQEVPQRILDDIKRRVTLS